jgi:hypothetical protein
MASAAKDMATARATAQALPASSGGFPPEESAGVPSGSISQFTGYQP